MAGEVFESVIAHTLKETLDSIIDDPTDGLEGKLFLRKWCEEMDMKDAYEDVLEMAGPGLASEVAEGQEIPPGSLKEGTLTRYIARKFGLKLVVTEEAMEDTKYPNAIKAARRLKRAMYKTADIDATNMLVRGWNTAYVGGDGLPLFSASHTLPHGGTYSNTMATPMSPSRMTVIVASSAVKKFPGHDGVVGDNYRLKGVVCPVEQWAVWAEIMKSTYAPEPGQFNAINVVNSEMEMGDAVAIPYWGNTTTNYAFLTDADGGPCVRWRRKPRSRSWVENSQETMSYAISARWSRLWSNGRAMYGVQA
jgi:hypothetical protein